MRRIVIILMATAASILVGAGVAVADTPQAPQNSAYTFLISCPDLAPFLVTSPPGLFATVGVGTPVVVAPQGLFHGQMPEDLVMTCSVTNVSTGQTVEGPILIAPTTR
jgi:hypothetical protein